MKNNELLVIAPRNTRHEKNFQEILLVCIGYKTITRTRNKNARGSHQAIQMLSLR